MVIWTARWETTGLSFCGAGANFSVPTARPPRLNPQEGAYTGFMVAFSRGTLYNELLH